MAKKPHPNAIVIEPVELSGPKLSTARKMAKACFYLFACLAGLSPIIAMVTWGATGSGATGWVVFFITGLSCFLASTLSACLFWLLSNPEDNLPQQEDSLPQQEDNTF